MAVTKTLAKKSLRLLFDDGLTADGKPKTKAKSFSNINPQADDSALYTVASQIGSLSNPSLVQIEAVESNILTNN